MRDSFDEINYLGIRFTKYSCGFYFFWFVLGFFVTSPYLGWLWIPLVLVGAPLIGLYLVAIPYYLAMTTIGEFIYWVVSLFISKDWFLQIVALALRAVFYSAAVILLLLLTRQSMEVMNHWFI